MEQDIKDIELFIDFCRAPYNFEQESEEKSYKELSYKIEHLIKAYKELEEKNKEYTMKINNLISQIESAIDFMKTDKLKIKVDMYQQKEEDLKLEIVHLKKLLKEE